jgi:hypothetical protein
MKVEDPAAQTTLAVLSTFTAARTGRPYSEAGTVNEKAPLALVRVEPTRFEPRHRNTVRLARHSLSDAFSRPPSFRSESLRRRMRVASDRLDRSLPLLAPEVEPPGLEPAGLEPAGLDPPGLDTPGLEPPGLEPPGLEPPGLEPAGGVAVVVAVQFTTPVSQPALPPPAGLEN